MNVALEDAEELSAGQVTARYGDCFVRGNNGELLANFHADVWDEEEGWHGVGVGCFMDNFEDPFRRWGTMDHTVA